MIEEGGRRVVVGVSGSVASLAALRHGLSQVRRYGGTLWAVLAWSPPGGEVSGRSAPPRALVREWESMAQRRLRTAFEEGLGGVPQDVQVRLLALRGRPAPALLQVAGRGCDLLVLGSPRQRPRRALATATVAGHCAEHACCPLVVVPPPPMSRQLGQRVSGRSRRTLTY
jgi:nucleotide-binding universal stress UspA family protein